MNLPLVPVVLPVVLLGAALLAGCSDSADEASTAQSPASSSSPAQESSSAVSPAPERPSMVQFREVRASGSDPGTTALGDLREEFESLDCAADPSLTEASAGDAQVTCDARGVRYALEPAALVTRVQEARVDVDESGSPLLTLTLDEEAAADLGRATRELARTRARLAVVVDGSVVRVIVVATPIEGGILQIPGDFTEAAADDLVRRLTLAP